MAVLYYIFTRWKVKCRFFSNTKKVINYIMRVNEFLEYMNSGKTVKESENLKSSEAALVSENKSGR